MVTFGTALLGVTIEALAIVEESATLTLGAFVISTMVTMLTMLCAAQIAKLKIRCVLLCEVANFATVALFLRGATQTSCTKVVETIVANAIAILIGVNST